MRHKQRLEIVNELCDGYSYIEDEELLPSYKKTYCHIHKDGKVLFPFIQHVMRSQLGFTEKANINIPKNKCIVVVDGVKKIQ